MSIEGARELLDRRMTPELHAEIRDLWKRHSIAEDARDLEGLMATLTEDCVYELVSTGHVWNGHEGARRFYESLLAAFPDISFHLDSIVIGPQGVFEEAWVTATRKAEWAPLRGWPDLIPAASPGMSGGAARFKVAIFFPWDPGRRKFRGERVYLAAPQGRRE